MHKLVLITATLCITSVTNLCVGQVVPKDSADLQLPDSTYLRLVGDLPEMATFTYWVSTQQQPRTNVRYEMRNADVVGCQLYFEIWLEQIPELTLSSPRTRDYLQPANYFHRVTYDIPLDAIDINRITTRAVLPRHGELYMPQPWELRIIQKRNGAQIKVGNLDSKDKRPASNMLLRLKNGDDARMLADWLRDAGARCLSWHTGPLKPIN